MRVFTARRPFTVTLFFLLVCSAVARAGVITSGDSFVEIKDIPTSIDGGSSDAYNHYRPQPGEPLENSRVLCDSWWWFRIEGDNDETVFHSPVDESFVGNTATFTFDFPQFKATLQHVLNDNVLVETLRIDNSQPNDNDSAAGMWSVDLFHIADIELGGDAYNDFAEYVAPGVMFVNSADGPGRLYYEAPDSIAYMLTDNHADPNLEDFMRDGLVTNFDNSGLPFKNGDGDLHAGFQWRLSIAPGEIASVAVRFAVVPEPAALLLALVGLALLPRRRRK
jgi:hypothetical protein